MSDVVTYCRKAGKTIDTLNLYAHSLERDIDRLKAELAVEREKNRDMAKDAAEAILNEGKEWQAKRDVERERDELRAHVQTLASALAEIESVPSCQEEECCTGGKVWAIAHSALSAVPADLLKHAQARDAVVEIARKEFAENIVGKCDGKRDVDWIRCQYCDDVEMCDALAKLEV